MRTTDELLEEQTRYLRECIHNERMRFEAAIKPMIDQLVRLESLRPSPPLLVKLPEGWKANEDGKLIPPSGFVAVAQASRCNRDLQKIPGQSYPRTCAECGLGPCKKDAVTC
jgi:hypothetical protein